ncbi:hypothetical protein BUALT_Bualt05G0049700 [Buddleja alternifolia]|uniref:Cation/H+ exchanger domain-containing protein n=1 Tax=Buddleja alternifolia TaxID=168488 RepID=A0AAV6XSU4_9LAMI|nr:hypothetical protein BUALT_Bualt05G0049700 [Buddleja alternifolia]
MGVALSITAFPVLARILAELKLLTTDVGRMAMSAAAVNDVAAWILLALAIALSGTGRSPVVSLWVFLCGFGFIMLCIFVGPPIFKWIARRCPEGEPVDEIYMCYIGFGFGSWICNRYYRNSCAFWRLCDGCSRPKRGPVCWCPCRKSGGSCFWPFSSFVLCVKWIEDKCSHHPRAQSWGLLVLVIFTACFGKIVGTVLVSLCCKIPFKEALTLGFLMNTKGLVELIVLNIGKDRGVLNDQTFAIMVLMALFTTFITTPIVMTIYKPAKMANLEYKHRTIQRKEADTQLRMFTCFQSTRNIPSLINLMEASRGTGEKKTVYHLEQGRDSETNQIVVAFEAFQHLSQVSIRPTTAISPMLSMHEDICTSAERKRAAIIILPFHKHQRLDGHLETTRADLRHVNRRVLVHAPCSVGILVDRGLGGTSHVSASNVDYTITAFFFGGYDDHEALSYGALMAEHTGIRLNAVRFIVDPTVVGDSIRLNINGNDLAESGSDDEFLTEFKEKVYEDGSIKYEEIVVRNVGETVDVIRRHNRCNLFIVGRMPEGQLVAGLNKKTECPELGPVGNLLISPEFSTTASVLVVQQYRSKLTGDSLASLKEDKTTEGEYDSE